LLFDTFPSQPNASIPSTGISRPQSELLFFVFTTIATENNEATTVQPFCFLTAYRDSLEDEIFQAFCYLDDADPFQDGDSFLDLLGAHLTSILA